MRKPTPKPKSPIRVLLLEDVRADAELAMRELKRAGLRTQTRVVSTEEDFRSELTGFAPDVILSDFTMPGFDGMFALSLARELRPEVPFIFVSGTIGEEYAVRALQNGAHDYVLKANLVRLPAAVERALQDASARAQLRQVERALAESEAGLRRAQLMAQFAHVVTGTDGAFESWSATLPQLIGVAAGKMPASTREWLKLLHPEDRAQFRATSIEAGRRGSRMSVEYRLQRADGAWIHIRQVMEPLDDGAPAQGEPRWFNTLHDVTAQKQATEALRESEVRFRSLTEISSDWYWEQDAEMRFVSTAGRESERGGISAEVHIGKRRWELPGTDIVGQSWAQHQAVLAKRQSFRGLLLKRTGAAGDVSYVEVSGEPFFDASGAFAGYRGVAKDVTVRQQTELALRESEVRYRQLIEVSPDAIFVHSDWRIVLVNQAMLRLFRAESAEQLLGREVLELIAPESRDIVRARISRMYQDGASVPSAEISYLRADGTRFSAEATAGAFNYAGRPASQVVVRDITERKRAEQELIRFQRAMDVSVDSIYLTDPATMRFVYLNATACQRLGHTREDLLQKGPQDVLPMSREQIRLEYDAVIAAGDKGTQQERRFVRRDGSEGWSELRRQVLQTEAGTLIISIGRDITERKEAEEKINRLNRVYAVLSGINSAIVRIGDRDELFREACRIAVEQAGFLLAWIGVLDADSQELKTVAMAGTVPEFAQLLRPSVRGEIPAGQGTSGRAFREKRPVVENDMSLNPGAAHLREAGLKHGIHSALSLPLLVEGMPVGVLTLYAGEKDYFDDAELKLLSELASDIALAIDHIGKRDRLDYLAFHDALTGLPNRTQFNERLARHIRAAGTSQGKLAVVVADIERFRMINDSLGRHVGDALLKQISQRLSRAAGPSEVARIGSDQFALLLPDVKGRSEVGRTLENIWHSCLDEQFRLGESEIRVAMKGGVAIYPSDGGDADTVFRNAEAAWKKSKPTGERYLFHAAEMTARVAENLALENSLRQALEKEEFVLHYQPKVDLEGRAIVGVEALIRWQSPALGLVPPMQFIPLLEATGLILHVGAWALKQASLDHRKWVAQGLKAPRVAVNVSPIQLRQRDFVAAVERAIKQGVAPTGIDLEITESLIMEDIQGSIEKLKTVRSLGVRIAIDDFGTGYSSLGYLAKLPVQTLKIDRSFVITMLGDPDTMTLVSTIISLAHSLRLNVVAEGVDSEEQAKVLRLLRCDAMQGYLFSKPVPFDEMTAMLKREKQD